MMKYCAWFAIFAGMATSFSTIGWSAGEQSERVASSRAVIKTFGADLQKELKAAIEEKGPEHAIGVCQTVAPSIALRLSEESGWDVGRTALQLRNPGNQPDAWEQSVLEAFEERKANGEDVETLEHFELVRDKGRGLFRYMKAIPTGDVCLTCHGNDIPGPVQKILADLYPDDRATGFSVSDIRGAFTITQPVD